MHAAMEAGTRIFAIIEWIIARWPAGGKHPTTATPPPFSRGGSTHSSKKSMGGRTLWGRPSFLVVCQARCDEPC